MSKTHWTDRLSEYLDGDLLAEEREALEEHLGTCPECTQVLAELRAVVSQAQGLKDTPPPNDLWGGIARAIASLPREDHRVIDLSPRLSSVDPLAGDKRLRLSISQVAAASLFLIVGSATVSWSLRPMVSAGGAEAEGVAAAVVQVSLPGGVGQGYAEEITQLESLLSEHRDELDPNTVRILEKNLTIIDRAIDESGEALSQDPSNGYLREHLDRAVRRKVDYLRDASLVSGWSG
jgi:hypothetical protein